MEASGRGRIVAFSRNERGYFCLAEFDGVGLVCTLKSAKPPKKGQNVTFLGHQRTGSGHAFEVEAV